MRLNLRVAALTTILCLALPVAFAKTAPAPKSGQGTIVIVFKDGHRQSFNLSEIERVEFPAAPVAAVARHRRDRKRRLFGRRAKLRACAARRRRVGLPSRVQLRSSSPLRA